MSLSITMMSNFFSFRLISETLSSTEVCQLINQYLNITVKARHEQI